MAIRIEDDFKHLIPPLTKEEFDQLEQNILDYGIRDPLVVAVYPGSNGEVLIDGHNRYQISINHGNLPYSVKRLDFDSKESALVWMVDNQLGKRNLQKIDMILLQQKRHELTAIKAKEKSLMNLKQNSNRIVHLDNSGMPSNTREAIAKDAGVGSGTVARVEVIQKNAPEEIERIRSGETTINKVYNSLKPKADKKSIIKQAEEEHISFSENKGNSVVSIQEIKEDKENLDILSSHYAAEIISAINKIERADFRAQSVKPLILAMDRNTLQTLRNNIARAEIIFSRLISFIEGVNK